MSTDTVERPAAFEAIVRQIGARTGLVFPPHRLEGVELGLRRAMGRARIADLEHYRHAIEIDAVLFDDLISELTIGETYFFRDDGQYELIRRRILPEVRERRGCEHILRVWSAGCASGEEPYSLAMLFAEEGVGPGVHLLATDISRAALARAQAARYRAWSLRHEGGKRAERYLEKQGEHFVLAEAIRRRVAFEWLNLALDGYPSPAAGIWGMDLILCRNVLIYFDPATIEQVARRLYASLADGGWLLTAASDPPLGDYVSLDAEVTDAGVAYRRAHRDEAATPALGAMFANQPARPQAVFPAGVSPVKRSSPVRRATPAADWQDEAQVRARSLRALANVDPDAALRDAGEAVERHPFSTELHYLHALLLMEHGRDAEAEKALRRVLYLDRSLAAAHFTLGSLLERAGDVSGARRAYRNALDLCASRPANEVLPLADGEAAGRLAEATGAKLVALSVAEAI